MYRLKEICRKIVTYAPMVLGLIGGAIIGMGLVGILDLGFTFATIANFLAEAFVWIIGILIGLFVLIAVFPGIAVILIAVVLLAVILLLCCLIGALL